MVLSLWYLSNCGDCLGKVYMQLLIYQQFMFTKSFYLKCKYDFDKTDSNKEMKKKLAIYFIQKCLRKKAKETRKVFMGG